MRIVKICAKNYKSYRFVEESLGKITVLVGVNGSGKSNFLDIFNFVADALSNGLGQAIKQRGGFKAIATHLGGRGKPPDVSIEITVADEKRTYEYKFILGAKKGKYSEVVVKKEKLSILESESLITEYEIIDNIWKLWPIDAKPSKKPDALALPLIAALPQYERIYKFLTSMGFYRIYPGKLREPQKPDAYYPLKSDGVNLASVLNEIQRSYPETLEELKADIRQVIPNFADFRIVNVGGYYVIEIEYKIDKPDSKEKNPRYQLIQISDGTLRLLAILTAIHSNPPLSVLGIEEPELTVHPGILAILAEALIEAAERSQILITTHSPDFIDLFDVEDLRMVEMKDGISRMSTIDEKQKEIVKQKLFTIGELLRIEGLRISPGE